MRPSLSRWRLAILLLGLAAAPAAPAAEAPRPVDFVRDVQPILNTYCLSCHGPAKQKGGLRLDRRESALETGNILPGKAASSSLFQRAAGLGPDKPMPPSGPRLSPRQLALVKTWIDQGANWPLSAPTSASKHWAYAPLTSPTLPPVRNNSWVRNPVDAFILAKLESKGFSPAPEADRRTLIRRLSFDLTGWSCARWTPGAGPRMGPTPCWPS
jgi:mono/diheme cytochrome c family protein